MILAVYRIERRRGQAVGFICSGVSILRPVCQNVIGGGTRDGRLLSRVEGGRSWFQVQDSPCHQHFPHTSPVRLLRSNLGSRGGRGAPEPGGRRGDETRGNLFFFTQATLSVLCRVVSEKLINTTACRDTGGWGGAGQRLVPMKLMFFRLEHHRGACVHHGGFTSNLN